MKRLCCWFGWHHHELAVFSHTCALWVCRRCPDSLLIFVDDPKALSEVEQLNEWWMRSNKNHVGR